MKGFKRFNYPKSRPILIIGGLLLLLFLQACSTYSSSRGYSTRGYSNQGYSNQPQIPDYHRGHGYYGHRYYGSYQPGWFISAGYPGAYYGSRGYGPVAYWPTYSYSYYRNAYYPYYDPWYYAYSSHYRQPYGYGYGSGYWRGHPYGNRPYYGNSHSYRPPGQYQEPTQNRPDPVVISPNERRRRGVSDGFNQRVDEGTRQRETHQSGRRSVTVINEEQDLSRSVGVAPTQSGDQGMSISSRSDRKVRASRLEPVGTESKVQQADEVPNARSGRQRGYSSPPVQRPVPANSGRNSRAYAPPNESARGAPATVPQNRGTSLQIAVPIAVPPARSEPAYRQAPTRKEPAHQPPAPRSQPVPRSQPAYEQRLDSSNVVPRAERRRSRNAEPERDR